MPWTPIVNLTGPAVELRESGAWVQWRVAGSGGTWINLLPLSSIQGLPGVNAVENVAAVAGYVSAATVNALQTALAAFIAKRAVARKFVPLIVFVGESNSGGQALNTALTANEKLARPAVQILNNTSLAFEPLQIGVNNNIDHFGITNGISHGWEAGLASSAEAFEWADQVYLVKAGQGGSTLSQWNAGGTYMTKYTNRVTAAIAAIRASGYEPQIYIWASIGINDWLASTAVATFHNSMFDWVARLRVVTGSAPVLLTRLPVKFDTYNAIIDKMDVHDALLWAIRTQESAQDDANHWGMAGMKRIARSMIDRSVNTIGQGTAYQSNKARADSDGSVVGTSVEVFEPIVWTSASSGVVVTSDGGVASTVANVGALGGAFDTAVPFALECMIASDAGNGAVVYLDNENSTFFTWTTGLNFLFGIYRVDGSVYYTTSSTAAAPVLFAATTLPVYVRMKNRGQDLIVTWSLDGGLTFPGTFVVASVFAGVATTYLKTTFAIANAAKAQVSKRTLVL